MRESKDQRSACVKWCASELLIISHLAATDKNGAQRLERRRKLLPNIFRKFTEASLTEHIRKGRRMNDDRKGEGETEARYGYNKANPNLLDKEAPPSWVSAVEKYWSSGSPYYAYVMPLPC